MAKIYFKDEEKLKLINPDTLKIWKKYEMDMSLRDLSEQTKAGYKNDMEHFWIYLYDNCENIAITEVTSEMIEEFLYSCKMQGNNSRRLKRRLSTISAFFLFMRKKRIVVENPIDFIERSKKDVDVVKQTFLTMEQVNLMVEKLNEEINKVQTVQQKHFWIMALTYAMFSLSTLARVNAVSNVRWENINFEERIVSDVIEKEGYIVDLSFSENVKTLLLDLKKYREENNIDDGGFVFIGTRNGVPNGVVPSTLHVWCKRIGALIGVPTLHAHDFRHSGSQLMMLNGAKLEDISLALNHKGTEVTRKHYLRADKSKIRESKDKFGL